MSKETCENSIEKQRRKEELRKDYVAACWVGATLTTLIVLSDVFRPQWSGRDVAHINFPYASMIVAPINLICSLRGLVMGSNRERIYFGITLLVGALLPLTGIMYAILFVYR